MDEDKNAGKLDEGHGVAVVFDEDDEDARGGDEDADVGVIRDSDEEDSDDEGGVEADAGGALAAGVDTAHDLEDDKGTASARARVSSPRRCCLITLYTMFGCLQASRRAV